MNLAILFVYTNWVSSYFRWSWPTSPAKNKRGISRGRIGNTSLGSPVTWWGTGMEEISNGWLSHLRCLRRGWTGKGLAEFIRAIESKIHNEKVTVWYLKNEHEQAYMRRYMTFMKTYPQYFVSKLLYFTTNSDR